MRIFLKHYSYELSNPTVHKYMTTILGLRAIIIHRKPGYKRCRKHKIFDDLLKQNFKVNSRYMKTEIAITTLQKALEQEHYPKGIILHSDQGGQFTSWDFTAFLQRQWCYTEHEQSRMPL